MAAKNMGAADTVDSYQPVVVTAYDYYPFGQYMPTRYTEDTNTYCFTTTRTEMVTVVTWVPLPFGTDLGNGGVTTLGGGVVFEAGDAIGIELRSTTAGDGFSFMISGQMPNVPAELHVSLERVLVPPGQGDSGAAPQLLLGDTYNVLVTDDSTGDLLGSMILDPGQSLVTDFTVPFAAKGGLASVSIVALGATPGYINIHVGVPHYSYVPHSAVSTVCNDENYRYGFNGQMKVNEWAGKGNHYDYGARAYDPRIARWNARDPLALKYPGISSYAYCYNSPIVTVDPDAREGIVVSGQPGDHLNREHFLVNGLDRAKTMSAQYKKDGNGEKATWLIFNRGGTGGYDASTIAKYTKLAEKSGIAVKVVSNASEIIEYMNEKNGSDSRSQDQISKFSYFGHATPGDLDVGFEDHGRWNMLTNEKVEPADFNSDAFKSGCTINVVGGCRTAVDGDLPGESSVIDQFSKKVDPKSSVKGSDVRVNYPGGVVSDKQLVAPNKGNVVEKNGTRKN